MIRLMKIELADLTLYWSDRAWGSGSSYCVFNGQIYEPLVLAFDTIEMGEIDPVSYEVAVSEVRVTVSADVPVGGYSSLTELFSVYDPHYAPVTIQEIPNGATDATDAIDRFVGKIENLENMLTDQVTLVCSGYELAVTNKFDHTIVDTTDYPDADPDDVGKMLPIAYGQAKRVPFLAVDAGWKTTIRDDITSTSPADGGTMVVSDASGFPSSGAFTIQIDSEQIRIASRSGETLTLAASGARGYNSTTAAGHNSGSTCAEVQTEYVYLIGHAVKAINDVYVDGVLQPTGNYTAYTGQSGDQYGSYGAKAAIVFNTLPIIARQTIVDNGHSHESTNDPYLIYRFDTVTAYLDSENLIDSDFTTSCTISYYSDIIELSNSYDQAPSPGTIDSYRICVATGAIGTLAEPKIYVNGDSSNYLLMDATDAESVVKSSWFTPGAGLDTLSELADDKVVLTRNDTNTGGWTCYEVWLEVKYTPTEGDGITSYTWEFDWTDPGYSGSENVVDGDPATNWEQSSYTAKLEVRRAIYSNPDSNATLTQYRIVADMDGIGTNVLPKIYLDGDSANALDLTVADQNQINRSEWFDIPAGLDTFAKLSDDKLWLDRTDTAIGSAYYARVWLEIVYTSPVATATTDISINSSADTVIGESVSADVDGYQDDASGTYTGTANALIERPDHVLKHILIAGCGLTSSQIDSTSYVAAGTFYSTNSYVLAFALLQRPNIRNLLQRIAYQAKSVQFWEAGKHHLVHVPDSETTDLSIDAFRIDLNIITCSFTQRVDIQNDFAARYDRYWDSSEDDDIESDRAVVTASDTTSADKYGTLIGDSVSLAYIPGSTQAQAVLDWRRDDLRFPRLTVEFAGGFWLTQLERGDIIDFTDAVLGDGQEDVNQILKDALLGLVKFDTDQFRVIDVKRRSDNAVQVKAVNIKPLAYQSALLLETGGWPILLETGNPLLLEIA